MRRQNQSQKGTIYLLLLYGMMILAALLLTVAGGILYKGVTETRTIHDQQRATLAYVQSKVQTADGVHGVTVTDGPEGQALVLAEADSNYETRIYVYHGNLMEEFGTHDSAFTPENGTEICAAESFQIRMVGEQLLEIRADGRQALIGLRSQGGVTVAS